LHEKQFDGRVEIAILEVYIGLHQICWHNKSNKRLDYYVTIMMAYSANIPNYEAEFHENRLIFLIEQSGETVRLVENNS